MTLNWCSPTNQYCLLFIHMLFKKDIINLEVKKIWRGANSLSKLEFLDNKF